VIPYAELNDGNARVSDKEISNITEQSFVFCDAAKGDFIVVNVAGKTSVPHYVAELLHLREHDYEIGIINGWKTPINLCLPNKVNNSSFSELTYYRNSNPITSRIIQMPNITAVFPS
jgi:hypothetical protein